MSGIRRLPSGTEPGEWAKVLGVSVEAIELYLKNEEETAVRLRNRAA